MKNTELSPSYIQKIFDFTSKKFIKYYDVQLELVDHVASRIEEMMTEDSQLKFDDALLKVYKSFGIYGFVKVQEEKRKELERYWRRRFWRYIIQYFKLPKIIISILLAVILYPLVTMLKGSISFDLNYLLLTIIMIGPFFMGSAAFLVRRKFKNAKLKPFASVEQYQVAIGNISFFCWYPIFFLTTYHLQYDISLPMSFIIAINLILTYAMWFVFPKWLITEVADNYNHLDIYLT